ncbi:hypothetical protein JG688_00007092 [Phytophthora aleatoria]|uniref:Uncharacterized protein n=1 Tax=Phytophthora aleatoria TaxID=2496075 RepID=A0A8J5IPT3_9STRA|nr:hypothetical protein JG688_00007092 [Phytophthora aleatoria]
MEVKRSGTRDDVFTAVSHAPQSDLRGATGMDRWAGFLQLYESFITRELAQEHPQFARALRQLERDTRLEQERQSTQVLATLRIKDATISELQKVASEQREQLDVVLDELERRETKEDKDVQVGEERQIEDAAVQTESVEKEIKEVSTQTMKIEEESGILALLEKLEKELKTLEEKNLALERELQQIVKKNEKETVEGRRFDYGYELLVIFYFFPDDLQRMPIELEECLAKCAYLTSQNSKLAGRLKAEKETNKKHLKEQEELRSKLSARPETNSELKHTFEEYRDQVTASSSIRPSASEDAVQSKGTGNEDAVTSVKNSSPRSKQENESLREQLALREQENLVLVQSLCTIKEKCAQTEAFHQKEFRVKAAEHAESMESYMSTVNETLSRIESDKRRLEEENTKLRSSLQQLEEDRARNTLEKSQRSTTGSNTESTFDLAAYTQEKETLTTRIHDLELQLSRERKLVEVLEQKKHLHNQHEEQLESNAKSEALKAQQEYKTRCEVLQKWREKLQLEFADYQAVQRASQHESDRRIEFLSACIEEFVRVADDTAPTMGKTVSTKELYDVVMELARTRDTISSMKHHAQKKQKAAVSFREDSWSDLLFDANKEQNEPEMSEAMWWKLRASKTEAYVRSAMLQNDTFEDTIRQLELRMSNVKQELSSRLSREAQLMSQLAALKAELATTKEQAASLAEKYQHASVELEKRQGEASTRGDETQRARMAVQRKTELLSQQKAKVSSLQQELEQASKKLERLATAEKQTASLQQKAKEHTQQLLQARQSYQRCHEDNVQLSIHLEQMKERHASIVTRLKAARLENANLRAQCVKNSANVGTKETNSSDIHRGNKVEANAVSVASLSEETRALKRRVMQKQDVIVGYKAKVTEYEARLERQRETMVKLARTNRELQQGQRQRQQQEQEYIASVHARLEAQLGTKQKQLDGLRASVYDSFEAFVYCQPPSLAKTASSSSSLPESPIMDEAKGDDGKLFAIKRWTDFSVHDLEELKLTRDPLQPRHDKEAERNQVKRNIGRAALQEMEEALEANPEDCRAEICELLQCLCC